MSASQLLRAPIACAQPPQNLAGPVADCLRLTDAERALPEPFERRNLMADGGLCVASEIAARRNEETVAKASSAEMTQLSPCLSLQGRNFPNASRPCFSRLGNDSGLPPIGPQS